MPKNENIDAFWDIEDLIPKRPKKTEFNREFSDVSATEIVLDAQDSSGNVKIPPRAITPQKTSTSVLREYDESALISHVKIFAWPTVFEFYTKFCKDAARYFSLTHEPCEYVYFFSYMPQYEQMTVSQMSYYLYWRDEIRKGNYLKTDINYLFLYIYEIINLPDKIRPSEGAKILSRLWRVYRGEFRYLDKYLGEWLCDYCLIHHVSPDWDVLETFAGEIAGKVSLPEFYLKDGEISWQLIESISSYDYKKSKYYEAHKKEYDLHIPMALSRAVNRIIMKNPGAFGISPVKTSRDSYAGAIVSHHSKFKMEITRYALRKTSTNGEEDLKHILANLIKLAENQLRSAFGIKSRLSPLVSDADLKREILAYFEEHLPAKTGKSKKKETEEEAYMQLYEPKQKGLADISRALDIEKQAWETADLLSVDEEMEEIFSSSPMISEEPPLPSLEVRDVVVPQAMNDVDSDEEFGFIASALSKVQKCALKAALKNSFSEYCRSVGVMEENMRGEINEISMEYIGDMIIDGDFKVLEDYKEEIAAVLNFI